jgi:uncharacterized repeat protein (TIGR03803 family)
MLRQGGCRKSTRYGILKRIDFRVIVLAWFSIMLAAAQPALSQTLTTLYTFTGGADGSQPVGGLILDTAGDLYGATTYGGFYDFGAIFEVSTSGSENVLYSFTGSEDGREPHGGLVFDKDGNLYGTTYEGGRYRRGTVFELSPGGEQTVLHSFKGGADGAFPAASLIFDSASNLFGTTTKAGGSHHYGTVFEVLANGTEEILYSFSGTDGKLPESSLVFDGQGNLYGTTNKGGQYKEGVAFELAPFGAETFLYSFNKRKGGAALPIGGLVFDAQGNLYGTTFSGGAYHGGTVIEITDAGVEKVLYNFCAQQNCADGAGPTANLVLDVKGNLYGTTQGGGAHDNGGTVFELSPSGVETVLYSFCALPSCADGTNPVGSLVLDTNGNLYGVTFNGGLYSRGTVFKLTP